MVKHGNKAAASDLVNFHFSSSPPAQSHMMSPPQRSYHSAQNRQQSRRSVQDRSSARRKASSSMFHLHSSADHAFVIARCSKQGHSFCGPDEAVSWDAVRTVKCLVPFEDVAPTSDVRQEICPICLDTFTCPRITKCGHCFCLPCLLRHFHTQAEYKSQAVTCPCCGLPVYIQDLRFVVFESVQPPRIHRKMALVKLHRTKDCPAPYLPRHGAWRHSSPYSAPAVRDIDAVFCRFNYVDPELYQSQLTENLVALESALSELQQQQSRPASAEMEIIFLQMALELVRMEQQKAAEESAEERMLAKQYREPHAGMYQAFPERVFAKKASPAKTSREKTADANASSTVVGRPNRAESMDSTDSQHSGRRRREGKILTPVATIYLDHDTTHFYQSSDGQLCFLSRFNMTCLAADFTATIPDNVPDHEISLAQQRKLRPFPDVIEGNILDKESVHLTPEVRKRLPFLSHLPLHTDIVFVELDLNRILSDETVQHFKPEMEKRRKKRKNKAAAEKRASRIAEEKEEARIDELKTRFLRIDPNDEFFHASEDPPAPSLTGDDFGPTVSANAAEGRPSDPQMSSSIHTPRLSFRAAITSGLNSTAVTEDSFPSLSSSPSTGTESRNKPTWSSPPGWHGRARVKSVKEGLPELSASPPHSAAPVGKGKKSKGKKVLLFSTGGHRGGA